MSNSVCDNYIIIMRFITYLSLINVHTFRVNPRQAFINRMTLCIVELHCILAIMHAYIGHQKFLNCTCITKFMLVYRPFEALTGKCNKVITTTSCLLTLGLRHPHIRSKTTCSRNYGIYMYTSESQFIFSSGMHGLVYISCVL